MSNKFNDIDMKNGLYYQYKKIFTQIKLRRMKSHTKVFIFTTLDMQQSKISNT